MCNDSRSHGTITRIILGNPPTRHRGLPPKESEKSPKGRPAPGSPRVPKECATESEKSPKTQLRTLFGLFSDSCCFSPYRAPEAPGAEIPEKWEKLQNSPPRSNPRKWGKITEKLPKNLFSEYFFCNYSVIFPHFRGLDRGGEFCNFSPFFRDFRLGVSVRGKTTRNPWYNYKNYSSANYLRNDFGVHGTR